MTQRARYRHAAGQAPRNTAEKDWQSQVEQLATMHGWLWFHDRDSRRNNAGLPDLLLVKATAKADVQIGGQSWKTARFTRADIQAGTIKTVATDDIAKATVSSLLGNLDLGNLPTGGIVALEFHTRSWQEILPGQGQLLFVDFPKNVA